VFSAENKTLEQIFKALLVFMPISWILFIIGDRGILLFIASLLSIIPTSKLISDMTATIAKNSSSLRGAFINAAFGNVTEVFIAFFALAAGLVEVVKAAIIGSLLANLLLLLGLSLLLGGLKYKEQRFNSNTVGIASTMLIIAFAGFTVPSLFSVFFEEGPTTQISIMVSGVLIVAYLLGVVFTFFTHKHYFEPMRAYSETKTQNWNKGQTIAVLAIATTAAAFQANLLVESLSIAIGTLGLGQIFVGIVIIGVVGNVAEMTTAISAALRNNVNLAINVAIGSTTQVAMFVVPLLVFLSVVLPRSIVPVQLDLVFNLFQIISVLFAVMIVNYLSSDGRCNWLEGVQLVSVYLIIAVAFFFVG